MSRIDSGEIFAGCIIFLPELTSSNQDETVRCVSPNCISKGCQIPAPCYNHFVVVVGIERSPRSSDEIDVTFLTVHPYSIPFHRKAPNTNRLVKMTSTPPRYDAVPFTPIGMMRNLPTTVDVRARYWLEGGQNLRKTTFIRLHHQFTLPLTRFRGIGLGTHPYPPYDKGYQYRLDEGSYRRLLLRMDFGLPADWVYPKSPPRPVPASNPALASSRPRSSSSSPRSVKDKWENKGHRRRSFTEPTNIFTPRPKIDDFPPLPQISPTHSATTLSFSEATQQALSESESCPESSRIRSLEPNIKNEIDFPPLAPTARSVKVPHLSSSTCIISFSGIDQQAPTVPLQSAPGKERRLRR